MAIANSVETYVLQWDTRLGGKPRLIFAPEGELMQIPPEILKCVGFIGCQRNGEVEVRGTFFLVAFPVEGAGFHATYAVTARHVIERLKSAASDNNVHLRVNTKSGAVSGTIEVPSWTYHDDPRVDVAVAPIGLGSDFEHFPIPGSMFLTKETIDHEVIGPGDDLFFPGLFSRRPGEQFNIPIMRTGTIAAMPGEPFETEWGTQRAYLVEARSIGGLSGSPVFVYTGLHRRFADNTAEFNRPVLFHFLGMVHGHYGIKDLLDSADTEDSANVLVDFQIHDGRSCSESGPRLGCAAAV